MATKKQHTANQKNARKSTGPRTRQGKVVSSRNALQYGLHSQMLVLPDEDPQQFQALSSNLQEYFQPVGIAEKELVNRIAILFWRLQRTCRIEASILTKNYFRETAQRADDRAETFVEDSEPTRDEELSQRRGTSETEINEHGYTKAIQEAEEAEQQMDKEITIIGDAYLWDATGKDALTKLSRYETTFQRNLSRTFHDLQRLQAARRNKTGVPPDVEEIDITVSKRPILQRLP